MAMLGRLGRAFGRLAFITLSPAPPPDEGGEPEFVPTYHFLGF